MNLLFQAAVAFLAVSAFAVLFRAPLRLCPLCGLAGTVEWVVYLLCFQRGMPEALAVALATLILLVLSRSLAVLKGVPATLFVVTGIFPVVPGAGIYYTAYALIMNDMNEFSVKGVGTVKTALAIAIGILLGNAVPQRWFNRLHRFSHWGSSETQAK